MWSLGVPFRVGYKKSSPLNAKKKTHKTKENSGHLVKPNASLWEKTNMVSECALKTTLLVWVETAQMC